MTTRNHISDFAIQRMNNVSHDQFVAQLLERAQTDEHLLHFCGDEVEALAAAASHEGRAIRKGRKSIYTKQIMKADRNRVRLYNTFKHYVHTFAQMNQENTADAAAHLQLHIDAIGIDPTYQLDRKSGLFIVFLHGLETDLAPYVEILHLEFLVQCIKEANDALRTVTEQRDNERVKRGKAAMRKARQATDDAYCKLVQAISYFTVTKGKAELLNFVAYLNHHIRHYRRYAFGKHQQTQTEKTEQREIDSRDQILAVQAGTIQGEETPPETKLSDSAR